MATKYDGLIIPRSYNDYINKSDGPAILQAMRQSGIVPTEAAQNNQLADKAYVDEIKDVIPAQASSSNQLADKAFVNSSIGTNTANYISDDGEPFESVAALEAYTGNVTNNDYAFVTGVDDDGNAYYDRYKATVSGSSVTWGKEYRLNNSSFTAVQWAAITSGITANKVSIIDYLAAGYEAVCDSAADAANKVITITGYHGSALPRDITVVFTNGNTYGDTTLTTPESVTASFYNDDGDLLNASPLIISDSRGHNAGKGFCNAGDKMDLRNDSSRTRIMNSDIRQADENYIIKSDGFIKQFFEATTSGQNRQLSLPVRMSKLTNFNIIVMLSLAIYVPRNVVFSETSITFMLVDHVGYNNNTLNLNFYVEGYVN